MKPRKWAAELNESKEKENKYGKMVLFFINYIQYL